MATDKWFYSRNGKKSDAVASSVLKQLARSGDLSPDDLVWREGMSEWAPALKVKGLFPEEVVASSPPPLPKSHQAVADVPQENLDSRYSGIYCSSDDKKVLGLAGGLAHKFGLPVGAVRVLIFISLFFVVGWGYLAGLFLPKLPTKAVPSPT
jgi:phage shock protein PspC (stress-responsive transcriptional regulator)